MVRKNKTHSYATIKYQAWVQMQFTRWLESSSTPSSSDAGVYTKTDSIVDKSRRVLLLQ